MRCEFTIIGTLPGMNEIISKTRYNRFLGAIQKKKETDRCGAYIIAGNVPFFKKSVKIYIRWIEPNLKRDIDNISAGIKFILDALVKTRRIPNDNRKWIKGISHQFSNTDSKNPRIEVIIDDENDESIK